METTAELRKRALEAEKSLQWWVAQQLWEMAIDRYPNPVGASAKHDIERMRQRARSCRQTHWNNEAAA